VEIGGDTTITTLLTQKQKLLTEAISETKEKLKSLDDQAAESNAALVKIGEAGETLESVDDSISGVVTKLLGVTTAVVALGTAAVTTTADFETAMSKVKSLISSSSTDLEGYMLSFNFNKNKKIGLKKLVLGDRILIEAVI